MGKKSKSGNAYFYAMGQRDNANGIILTSEKLREMRKKLEHNPNKSAYYSWWNGFHGFKITTI